MELKIIGAGHAGLIAAQLLNWHEPVVFEKQPKLPENHHSVLRMKTDLLSQVLGLPLRRVHVLRETVTKHYRTKVATSVAYSHKNTGTYQSDRSLTDGEDSHRYLYMGQLSQALARGVDIKYSREVNFENAFYVKEQPIVSTIPMPFLMHLLKYPKDPDWEVDWGEYAKNGYVGKARMPWMDVYATVYYPDPFIPWSRIHCNGEWILSLIHI